MKIIFIPRARKLLPLFLLAFPFAVPDATAAQNIGLVISAYALSANSDQIQSRLAGTQIEGLFQSELLPSLFGRIRAGIQLESGSGTSLFNRQFDPRQSPQFKEAIVTWRPAPKLPLSAGALNQNDLQSPLLLQNQTFPSLREEWQYGDRFLFVNFLAQQSVAADTWSPISPSRVLKSYAEFYIEQIGVHYRARRWSGDGTIGHFLFNDLQAGAAFPSRFRGNSVTGIGETNSAFLYEYQGLDLELKTSFTVSAHVDTSLEVSGLWNYRAPSGSNRGYRIAPGLEFDLTSQVRLAPSIEVFYLESDSTPAFFTDRSIGQTGCRGYALNLGIKLRQAAIDSNLSFVHSEVLQTSLYQSGIQWIQVNIRKQYDVL